MNYWLLKTEPDSYSWNQLVKDKTTNWSGVRSPAGRANLMKMKKGDRAFFYHTGDERQVVGVCEVVKEILSRPERRDRKICPGRCQSGRAGAASGDARRDQGRAQAGADAAGPRRALVGVAGDARGMEAGRQDGGPQSVTR